MALTIKQLSALDYIKKFIATNGYSPTIREVMRGVELTSPATVHSYLKKFAAMGIIQYDEHKSRTIELLIENEYLSKTNRIVNVPFLEGMKISKKTISIPICLLDDHEEKNIRAYKDESSIYLIDISRKDDIASLVEQENTFKIEEDPTSDIVGNIISELKIY